MNPGRFKERDSRAGNTAFVTPERVAGTLTAGWQRRTELDTAFERAVYMMFLVTEVHPFDDGNGRLARLMMNAELVAAGQSRIITPTVSCCLGAERADRALAGDVSASLRSGS